MRWLISLLFLAGCGTTPTAPPAYLMQDCPAPVTQASTNGELAHTLNSYRWALRACNDDKAALREFSKDSE